MSIQFITDSAADISPAMAEAYNIKIIPFYIAVNDSTMQKEGVELSQKTYYDLLVEGKAVLRTSCPSITDYTDVFEPILKSGDDIICICLSSKLSGSYQTAVNARNMLIDDYPDRKIEIIDSYSATAGQALLLLEAVRMKANSIAYDNIVDKLNEIKYTSGIIFTVDDLMYLQKNGRIGKASALIGSMLNIKPILQIDEGEVKPLAKVRSRKKAIASIMSHMHKAVKEDSAYRFSSIRFFLNENSENLSSEFSMPVDEINIGATIGTHTGATAVGVAYIKRYDAVTSSDIKNQKHNAAIEKKQDKLRAKLDKLEEKKHI